MSSITSAKMRYECAGLALVAIVAVCCYANALHAPFVFDDELWIVNNPTIKLLRDPVALWRANPGRFVPYFTFALNYAAGGLRVFGYHVVNVLIHVLTCWTLFWVLLLLQNSPEISALPARHAGGEPCRGCFPRQLAVALFAALLFAVHPVQIEAVTYIVQRMAALAALFYLLGLGLYVQAALLRDHGGRGRGRCALAVALLAGSLLSFALALSSKENAVTLPAAIVLVEVFCFGAWRRQRPRAYVLMVVSTMALIAFVVLLGRVGFSPAAFGKVFSAGSHLARGEYLLTQVNVIRTYIRLLFWPLGQNLDYDYPIARDLFDPELLCSAALIGLTIALGVALWRRERLVSYGIAFFFLALSVESSIIPIDDVIFEHRLYLPSVGFAIVVAGGLASGARRLAARGWSKRNVTSGAIFIAAAMIVAGAVLTRARNAVWADARSLWRDAAEKSPRKLRPHYNLAVALARAGDWEEAEREYRRALSIDPNYVRSYVNLGNLYQRTGRLQEALATCERGAAVDPQFADAWSTLGYVYQQMGRLDDAAAVYEKARRLAPSSPDVHRGLGKLYYRQQRLEQAEAEYRLALRLDPDSADAHNELGSVHYAAGRFGEAEEEYRRALALNPALLDAQNNLGNVYVVTGRLQNAEAAYRAVLVARPNDVGVHSNLGQAYEAMGRLEDAEVQYRYVAQRAPASPQAHARLAAIYQKRGMLKEAEAESRLARELLTE
jgi:tetratricopeptide (TPR) repeat protein